MEARKGEERDMNHKENVRACVRTSETAVQRLINTPWRQVLPNMEIQPPCQKRGPASPSAVGQGGGDSRFISLTPLSFKKISLNTSTAKMEEDRASDVWVHPFSDIRRGGGHVISAKNTVGGSNTRSTDA